MIKPVFKPSKLIGSLCAAGLAATLSTGASAIGIEDVVDGGNNYAWEKVELAGTKCSDGSQYKFWVSDSATSDNLLILYEGGGACWDYESCSGALGLLGAANPNGLADGYITDFKATYVSPLVNGADPGLPLRSKETIVTNGWDVAFMPYCTGDVHVGNSVQTYADPTGVNPPINFHHNGFTNSKLSLQYLANRYPNVNKMMITGFSAGGVASSAIYHEARQTINPTKGYMLNDSGPLFPAPDASFNSRQLHETIIAAWDMNSVFGELPAGFDPSDMGTVNTVIPALYPQDQFAYTGYSTDYNFSRFSYERFFPGLDVAGILGKWQEDQDLLIDQMNQIDNYSYHIPWNRPINDSHCSTIITFVGAHACPSIRKKRWWERWEWPWSQSWKCPGGMTGMASFLSQWVDNGTRLRLKEPPNSYNAEDPGMQIIGPQINDAL